MKYIASVSFGKDSLAMLILLLEKHKPLDEVIFYDTGMEFAAIYDIRDAILPLLKNRGILYTELRPQNSFEYDMLERPVTSHGCVHCGYSWCGRRARWGTTFKTKALDGHSKKCGDEVRQYIGIAADEPERLARLSPNKIAPLAMSGITEAECLMRCYKAGYQWTEQTPSGPIKLYDILDRVSCWCCANKNLRELRNIYRYLPDYWERLKQLQAKTVRPMKGPGKSVFDLEKRFKLESEWIAAGLSITNREFYAELARKLAEERTNL